ncbi:MAG: DUF2027 domain-containing protein [Bacteroides sp.]|nr:DUF2027 domain-containing protein [Ruminococcus flavefaciens]MCM1555595.1 DUF2027 domain-containing protein [Bacteroides sp.]
MKFNLGDKVKFMDQEGQGEITKIINANTVGVTTDGFEIPCSVTDLIKIEKPSSTAERLFYEGKGSYDAPAKPESAPNRNKAVQTSFEPEDEDESEDYEANDIPEALAEDMRISPLRRSFGGKNPQREGVYIALVPLDQQFMLRGPLEFHIVNYTPYTLLYNLATRGAESFYGVDFASVPPYSKMLVESVEREDLGLWTEGILQGLFYQDESPVWMMPFSKDYKIKVNHLGKQENYVFPVFMQQKTLLVPVLDAALHKAENGIPMALGKAGGKAEEAEAPARNIVTDSKNPLQAYMLQKDVAEVDLHVEKLLSTRLEFKNADEKDYLARQLQVFETCLNQAVSQRLSKIIFIHGVGNGILKAEMEKKLKQYENLHFMEASRVKYGAGALEVYIR